MKASSATDLRCHGCGGGQVRSFHHVAAVPVHSCLLMPTRQDAIDYPRGELQIAFCDDCGFIQNAAFDPSVHEYSPRYEETQAYSPRFRALVDELVARYDARYGLADKTVLEIGCGKGEFLVALCERTGARGIGIDPGYRPERTQSPAADRLQWIVDFYSEKYASLPHDVVLCRHTLEHIQPVAELVATVRRGIGERTDVVVAFELPDTERILEEQAFQDIYYEHCSYFTSGSLSRLFRRCGFRVVALEKCYEGQYLLLDAVPGAQSDAEAPAAEHDLERMRGLVTRFERDVGKRLAEWRTLFDGIAARGERAVLWGSGSKAVAFVCELGLDRELFAVTDINPHRHGMFLPGSGHEIVPPDALRSIRPDVVVAMNAVYRDEIGRELDAMGLAPTLLAI